MYTYLPHLTTHSTPTHVSHQPLTSSGTKEHISFITLRRHCRFVQICIHRGQAYAICTIRYAQHFQSCISPTHCCLIYPCLTWIISYCYCYYYYYYYCIIITVIVIVVVIIIIIIIIIIVIFLLLILSSSLLWNWKCLLEMKC